MGNSDSYFGAFRTKPFHAYYGEIYPSPVTQDKIEVGLIVAFSLLGLLLLLIAPASRGIQRVFFLLKSFGVLFLGLSITVSIYGFGWQTGELKTEMAYKAFTNKEIHATIGMHVGLEGLNITLKGDPVNYTFNEQQYEYIDYNEHFSWGWQQFRIGFGIYSNQLNREFRDAQWRGMPYPILWVAEYFTLDGEQIRWGRGFRQAGFYTNMMLWTAFALWFIDIVLFLFAPRAGSYFLGLTGAFLLTGNIVYAGVIHKWTELIIPFNDHASLKLHYGWSFYLIMVNGIGCILLAIFFLLLDIKWPSAFRAFFNYSVDEELEVTYSEDGDDEEQTETKKDISRRFNFTVNVRYRKTNRKPFPGSSQDSGNPVYSNTGAGKDKDGIELGDINAAADTHI